MHTEFIPICQAAAVGTMTLLTAFCCIFIDAKSINDHVLSVQKDIFELLEDIQVHTEFIPMCQVVAVRAIKLRTAFYCIF